VETVVRGHYRGGSTRGPGVWLKRKRQEIGRWTYGVAEACEPGSSAAKVASALATAIGADGRLDPTKEWIAAKVGLCVKTVTRALTKLRRLGFVTWQRRTVIKDGVEQQTSNAYQLQFPDPPETAEQPPAAPPIPPSMSLSLNREESILLDKEVLWDTQAPVPETAKSPEAPAPVQQVPRPLPYRVVMEARKVLADRVRASAEAWIAGAQARAADRKRQWREARGDNHVT
jgi:hypothetical protein